ncbi:MAG: YncE family protein [Spirochaetota bacterium]|nr:YncE family protein [Spirochaetota bacterium]
MISLFSLLIIAACQSISITHPPASGGYVSLYLSTSNKSPSDITFTLEKIEVEGEGKDWVTVFEDKRGINSINLMDCQVFLSEIHLGAGKYERMRVRVTDAALVRGGKKLSLALPSENMVVLPVRLQIYKNESTSLFLYWDTEKSIENKYLFLPSFTLLPQKMEITRIILYVTNTDSNSITVINRENDRVVGTIGVDKAPMGIVASPSGDLIYVANSGSNTISVIDTSHHRVIDTVPLNFGLSPREIAISPNGARLYVSNFHSNNVSIVDTVSKSIVGQLSVGNAPLGIAANTSGNRLYVANSVSNNLSVIDTYYNEVVDTIGVGSNPTDLMIDQNKLFVANAGSSNIFQISVTSLRIEKETIASYGSHKLVMGLMGNIYISNMKSNDISIIPSSTNIIIQNIAVGDQPQKMIVDQKRRKLYVANGGSDTVSVIDLVISKLVVSIPVGKRPYGLALVE